MDPATGTGQAYAEASQTILFVNGIYDAGSEASVELEEIYASEGGPSQAGRASAAGGASSFVHEMSSPEQTVSSITSSAHVIRGSHDAPLRPGVGGHAPREVHVEIPAKAAAAPAAEPRAAPPTVQVQPWQPYEAAPRENYLLPWLPLQFYQLRWAVMRCNPLTWSVGRRAFTYGEALVFGLALAQMVWVSLMWAFHADFRVDVILTGRLASLALMTTFFLSLHSNTIMLLVFGLPFDRQLPWHKLLAVVTIINGTFHAAAFYLGGRADSLLTPWRHHHVAEAWTHAYGMEVTGWLLFAPILAMSALGAPAVARRNFAGFYRTHVVLAFCAAVGAAFHGFGSAVAARYVPMSLPGGVFWLFDIFIRFAFGTRLSAEKQAQLRLIAHPAAPDRTVVEVSVENKRKHYTAGQWVFLCFPQLGPLHWHPFTISSASGDGRLSLHILCGDRWTGSVRELAKSGTVKCKAYIEGPYGAPMIDVHGTRYKCFVVVSGGVGWTFVRSWKRQLIADGARGRPIKMLSTIAVLKATDVHQLPEFVGWDVPGADSPGLTTMLAQEDVFLTGKREAGEGDTASLSQSVSLGVQVTRGRPDFLALLSSAARTAASVGESRVAVMVCGSKGIVDRVLATAREASTAEVAFDCHHEMFSF